MTEEIINLKEKIIELEKQNLDLHKQLISTQKNEVATDLKSVWVVINVAREIDQLKTGQYVHLDNVFVKVEGAYTAETKAREKIATLNSQYVEEINGIRCLCERSVVVCEVS